MNQLQVPIGISNRHIHLSKEDLEKLFGEGYELTNIKDLVQTGEFAADETVTVKGPKGSIEKVRILGPVRPASQVEISRTDGFKLGINAPVRQSGQVEGTPGCILVGPQGEVELKEGVIVADHHIHMSPKDAEVFDVKDGDRVSVHVDGIRALTFHNVLVRVKPSFVLEFHIDTDEANACLVNNNDMVTVIKKCC
ncbi:phosphate propanoyltransferase [Desulfitibacter alkalitolerans]|uniref:phosphate propanoyltransferase n=1 Tax=Desulfitibacter alkalitolerans TaxID=264641 RepID=UPI000487B015|nr:phosphate propanoyltransferase [Desulfitibacter alkalitolerans]